VAKLLGRSDFARFESSRRAIWGCFTDPRNESIVWTRGHLPDETVPLRERSPVKLGNLVCSGLFVNRSGPLGEVPPEDISPENPRKRVGRHRDYFLTITS